jgi:hypothetical protein
MSTTSTHDIRREAVGGYSGPIAPTATIGTYANRVLLRRQGTGSYTGNADHLRQGSYADVDRG